MLNIKNCSLKNSIGRWIKMPLPHFLVAGVVAYRNAPGRKKWTVSVGIEGGSCCAFGSQPV